MNKKKAAKQKDNPVYTQQGDSALLESTGTNPPDADQSARQASPFRAGKDSAADEVREK